MQVYGLWSGAAFLRRPYLPQAPGLPILLTPQIRRGQQLARTTQNSGYCLLHLDVIRAAYAVLGFSETLVPNQHHFASKLCEAQDLGIGLTESYRIKKLFKNWTFKLCSNVSFTVSPIVELKQESLHCKDLSRCDVKHDELNSGTTLEEESVREAHGGALSPSQPSTHCDAAGTISIHEIEARLGN